MLSSMDTELTDTLGRPLQDLRLSVIDQCNFLRMSLVGG